MTTVSTTVVPPAQRVAVQQPEPGVDVAADYADAFRLTIAESDGRSVEEWVRAGLEGSPAPLRAVIVLAHRFVLGFRLGPLDDPALVLGWRIVSSEPDLVHLRTESPLMQAGLVARRVGDRTAELSTYLYYRRRAVATAVWTAVGPLHRAVAPYLLRRAARG